MIDILNWIKNNESVSFFIGIFILIAIEEIGRAFKK